MTPLIAMPDCDCTQAMPGTAADTAFPELPALSRLLHGARPRLRAGEWRNGVLAALGMTEVDLPAQSLIAARAVAIPQGAGICMALPIHAVAGMSRMFLAPSQGYALDAGEREELRLAFNAEFGATDVHMHAVGSGWLFQSPAASAASDGSPETLQGEALTREPAASETLRSMRRLGTEIEMWLAGLAFNAARERRGQLPINSIWFWSGAIAAPVPPPTRPGALFTNVEPDAWLAGLGAHCGLLVQRADSWQQVQGTPGAVVILQPSQPGAVMAQMTAWESAWFGPVHDDLASQRLKALLLQIGGRAWTLPASMLSRWTQRLQPWWKKVCA